MLPRLVALALCLAAAASAATASAPADAQTSRPGQTTMLQMTCMVNGQPHRLFAQVETLGVDGAWVPRRGVANRVEHAGTAKHYYQGSVTGPLGQYYFTGENSFGQFFSHTGGSHTQARFDVIGRGQLLITIDPFGRPKQLLCRN